MKILKGRTFKGEAQSLGIRSSPGKGDQKGDMGGGKIRAQFTLSFMSQRKDSILIIHEAGILGDLRRGKKGDDLCHQEHPSVIWCYIISGIVCYQSSSLPPSSNDVVYFLFTSPSKRVV